MKRVLIITGLILIVVWVIGLKGTNSSQDNGAEIDLNHEYSQVLSEEISFSTPKIATTSPTRKASISKEEEKNVSVATAPSISTIPTPTPVITPEPTPDFEIINTFARKGVVNILCTVKNNELSPISGTGVIINSKGLVITNAHIAQYFLLRDLYVKDYITCVLRTGSPAYPKYNVDLVYISPLWVKGNIGILKAENPQGTGENDYAFLRITDLVDGSNLQSIPFVTPTARESITLNEPVILVSYPAGFLGSLSILKDLSLTSGITAVRDYFTFKEGTLDIISVPGTVVSQKGSSGGAVVDKNSNLLGIITTTSNGKTTGERDLAALTLAYINRSLKNEAGINLSNFLAEDPQVFGKKFLETEAPALTKLIKDSLNQTN